jgi:hypothetical protein
VSTTLLLPKEHIPERRKGKELFVMPCWGEEAPKPALVIDTVSGRDRPDPAFRTPSQLNMQPQKPFGGDLDINNPVADDCEQLSRESAWPTSNGNRPEPAVWVDVGELMLLVFTQDGVPTWEVDRRAKAGSSRDDLIASGTADTFEAAKAAALFEATAQSSG